MIANEAKLQKALSDLRAVFLESLRNLEENLASEGQRVTDAVKKRQELAHGLDLSVRLLAIYEDVKYYPDWSQLQPHLVSPTISNVKVVEDPEKSRYGHKESVDFDFRGTRWTFIFSGNRVIFPDGADGGYIGDLSLLDSTGTLLFEARYDQQEYSFTYKPLDIEAFVPDEWTIAFLELSEEITALDKADHLRHQARELQEQREKFGLSKTDNDIEKLTGRLPPKFKAETHVAVSTPWATWISWFKNKLSGS